MKELPLLWIILYLKSSVLNVGSGNLLCLNIFIVIKTVKMDLWHNARYAGVRRKKSGLTIIEII
jgi:hypothetical protein